MGDIAPNEQHYLDHTTAAQERLDSSHTLYPVGYGTAHYPPPMPSQDEIEFNALIQAHFERLRLLPLPQKVEMLEALLDEIRKWQSPPALLTGKKADSGGE